MIEAVAPSQVAVSVNEGSSLVEAVTVWLLEFGQEPFVVYNTSYVAPGVPLETVPVVASITAASPGAVLKLNVPPASPDTAAVPPSHVGVSVNDASSRAVTFTVTVELF